MHKNSIPSTIRCLFFPPPSRGVHLGLAWGAMAARPLICSLAFLTFTIFVESLLPCLSVTSYMYASVSLSLPVARRLHVFCALSFRCADVLEISTDVLKQAYEMQMYDYTRFLKSTRLFSNMSEVQVVLRKMCSAKSCVNCGHECCAWSDP
jgi:hypothetical protein